MECVACGGEVGDDDRECPSCGLYLRRDGVPRRSPRPPATPPAAASAHGLGVGAVVAAVAIGLAITALVVWRLSFVGGAADDLGRAVRVFERYADRPELAPADLPARADVDAELAAASDEERRLATSLHRPFSESECASIHAFFDAYLARRLELSPGGASRLDPHPHTASVEDEPPAVGLRWHLVLRDADRVLRAWPGADRLAPHDAVDRLVVLDEIDAALRRPFVADIDRLDALAELVDPLVRLSTIRCCDEGPRRTAAIACLRDLPARAARITAALEHPPRMQLTAAAASLDGEAAYLATYAAAWSDLRADERSELDAAVGPARDALTAAALTLRTEVTARAGPPSPIGRGALALRLSVEHHLPLDARAAYGVALDALRRATEAMRTFAASAPREGSRAFRGPAYEQVNGLKARRRAWIDPVPLDDGVAVVDLPQHWAAAGAHGVYLDPGAFASAEHGAILVGRSDAGRPAAEHELLARRHTLAHESYPGHRLQAVAARDACRLRRFRDDRLLMEGWAVYAVDLMHETGDCAAGPIDEWLCINERAGWATSAMVQILLAVGAIADDDIAGVYAECGLPPPTPDAVAPLVARGSYHLNYFLGWAEVVRLRAAEHARLGAAFDLKTFHSRLLAAGPISPRLIEEEWRLGASR